MHNHNSGSKDGGHKGMLWMMLPCILLVGFLFLGGSKVIPSEYLWLVVIGVCVIPHLWMMFRGHGGHGSDTENKATASEKPETNLPAATSTAQAGDKSKHGCCH